MKEMKMGTGRSGESGDCLAALMQMTCGESEEDLRTMVGHFVEVCKRRDLKVSAGADEAECHRRVASGRMVANAIMSEVIARAGVC